MNENDTIINSGTVNEIDCIGKELFYVLARVVACFNAFIFYILFVIWIHIYIDLILRETWNV